MKKFNELYNLIKEDSNIEKEIYIEYNKDFSDKTIYCGTMKAFADWFKLDSIPKSVTSLIDLLHMMYGGIYYEISKEKFNKYKNDDSVQINWLKEKSNINSNSYYIGCFENGKKTIYYGTVDDFVKKFNLSKYPKNGSEEIIGLISLLQKEQYKKGNLDTIFYSPNMLIEPKMDDVEIVYLNENK